MIEESNEDGCYNCLDKKRVLDEYSAKEYERCMPSGETITYRYPNGREWHCPKVIWKDYHKGLYNIRQ